MGLLNQIRGIKPDADGADQHQGQQAIFTIESLDEQLLADDAANLDLVESVMATMDDKIHTIESLDEALWAVPVASLVVDAQYLFGDEEVNTAESVAEVFTSIKKKLTNAKRRLARMVRDTGKALGRSLNVFKTKAFVRAKAIDEALKEVDYVADRNRMPRTKSFKLKSVRSGLCDPRGKFSASNINALIKSHQEIVNATLGTSKRCSSVINKLGVGLSGTQDDWYDSGWESAHDSVKKVYEELGKVGGGSPSKIADRTTKTRRRIPGGTVYTYGPFYGGKIMEMLIDTTGYSDRTGRLGKIRTINGSKADRKGFGDAEIDCLTLKQCTSMLKAIKELNDSILEVSEKGGTDIYKISQHLLDRVDSESHPGGQKGEHAKGMKRMIAVGTALTMDVLSIHGALHSDSLALAFSAIDAVLIYVNKSISTHV